MASGYIIIKQNQYMRLFKKAGATDPGHARPTADLGFRETRLFRRMVERRVFVAVGGGAYYIDLSAAREFVVRRRKRALVALALVLAVVLALFVFGRTVFR